MVIIGDESERMLHNRNINAFITLTEKRRRSITFSVTIQSNGNVTAYIIKICDDNCDAYTVNPRILGPFDDNIYVTLHHPSVNATTLAIAQYNKIIVPVIVRIKDRIIQDR